MPRGIYQLAGRSEAFSCAPGPAGWRFVSDRLDLACDTGFRPVRFVVTSSGGQVLRGGGLRLDDGTPLLVWAPADDPAGERTAAAGALLTGSPGAWVSFLRTVAPPGSAPVSADVVALEIDPDSAAALTVRRRVTRTGAQAHQAPAGTLQVETWTVDDLDTGARRELHLAGDVLVWAAPGPADGHGNEEIELIDLEGPPWQGPASV